MSEIHLKMNLAAPRKINELETYTVQFTRAPTRTLKPLTLLRQNAKIMQKMKLLHSKAKQKQS